MQEAWLSINIHHEAKNFNSSLQGKFGLRRSTIRAYTLKPRNLINRSPADSD